MKFLILMLTIVLGIKSDARSELCERLYKFTNLEKETYEDFSQDKLIEKNDVQNVKIWWNRNGELILETKNHFYLLKECKHWDMCCPCTRELRIYNLPG